MIDYIEQLESRGFECTPSGEHNVFILCPFHDEAGGSCGVNLKTGGFHCFGCDASGSFAKLIAEIDGIDIGSARLLLNDEVDISGIINSLKDGLLDEDPASKRRFITRKSYLKKFTPLDGDFKKYALARGLNDLICKRFDLRCGVGGRWSGRLMAPLRTIKGGIIGFTGRAIYRNPHLKVRSYIAYDGAINDILFGLYECKKRVEQERQVILVEGPIDTMYLQAHGFPTVGRLGKNLLSSNQVRLLVENVDRVLLSYDGDKNGLEALEKEYARLSTLLPVIPIRLPEDKDPNDLDGPTVKKIYKPYF